ncbi:hypothetical protein BOTBODRAFT_191330 [Botryobasidium botryosum FD-172 SS1]|uniref:BTB domain-containing protein n=1 Tax=Botryobasidium botryosum (strain FD-172 SS1) TaxID=930990 RepID=A0A067M087_BOTB1|nr:hypothetical protein BOTBODRAFT_191330 [Botryobasidium botryosum FD-172 SS1]
MGVHANESPSSNSAPGSQLNKRTLPADVDLNERKLQKTNLQDVEDLILIHHPKFWYPDGSVVVRVEDHLFRIHSSVLTSKSEFFVSFFEGGAELEGSQERKVEGCKVYELDGKKRHFSALLDALYTGISYPNMTKANSGISYFTLACLLRAAHHWNVPSCKEWAIYEISKCIGHDVDNAEHCDLSGSFATRLIALSRECDATVFLVPAFYQLLGTPKLHIRRPEPLVLEDIDKNYFHETEEWDDVETALSEQDITNAVALLQYANRQWWEFLSKPPDALCFFNCTMYGSSECSQVMGRIWRASVVEAQVSDCARDPLGGIQAVIDIEWGKKGICTACAKVCRVEWKKKMDQIWEGIGTEVLGLEPTKESTVVAVASTSAS